jgi:hypothetical protein
LSYCPSMQGEIVKVNIHRLITIRISFAVIPPMPPGVNGLMSFTSAGQRIQGLPKTSNQASTHDLLSLLGVRLVIRITECRTRDRLRESGVGKRERGISGDGQVVPARALHVSDPNCRISCLLEYLTFGVLVTSSFLNTRIKQSESLSPTRYYFHLTIKR